MASMKLLNRVMVGMMTMTIGSVAMGQLVPPAPPKMPATPEYTPPAVAPTPAVRPLDPSSPNAKVPDQEKPLPTLIERDEKGKIKPLAMYADEAAVRALELTDDAKKQIATSLANRRDDMDVMVIEKLEDLLIVRKAVAEANEQTGMNVILETGTRTAGFKNNTIIDRLHKDGAITMVQKTQATKISREYKTAVKEEASKEVGGNSNFQALMLVSLRLSIDDVCGEAFKELDRMIEAAAPKAEQLVKGMNLPASHAANRKVADLKRPAPAGKTAAEHRLGVVRSMFKDDFDIGQKQAFLRAANPELVEKAKSMEKPTDAPKPSEAPKKGETPADPKK